MGRERGWTRNTLIFRHHTDWNFDRVAESITNTKYSVVLRYVPGRCASFRELTFRIQRRRYRRAQGMRSDEHTANVQRINQSLQSKLNKISYV